MALNIVRHDITKIKADAIVNSTNEYFDVGGLGVDASIHYAAGPDLKDALAEIGYCPVGSSVVTESFNIPTCKYIIHAVAPVYQKGNFKEKVLLRKTYHSILRHASEYKCKSVAIPLLSAGANGYPVDEAYMIATDSIRGWLSTHYAFELDIMLVLFEKDAVELSKAIDSSFTAYITDHYTDYHKEELKEFYDYRAWRPNVQRPSEVGSTVSEPSVLMTYSICADSAERELNYADVDLSFAEMCEWWCKKKGIKKGQFFAASNITRATFSNMKLHPDRAPKKNTVLACAIGLKLDIDQAKDLLLRAGMAFSKHYPTDNLVEQCIRNRMYNIDEINYKLYSMDLMVLGYSKSE